MSLPGLSCKPSCPWMGNVPCTTGRERGGRAVVIPFHSEWRCIRNVCVCSSETVAEIRIVIALYIGLGGGLWWVVVCCLHTWKSAC